MPGVTVVDSNAVSPRPGSVAGLFVRPTVGSQTDFAVLEQAVLEIGPAAEPIGVGDAEETLFVLSGAGP